MQSCSKHYSINTTTLHYRLNKTDGKEFDSLKFYYTKNYNSGPT